MTGGCVSLQNGGARVMCQNPWYDVIAVWQRPSDKLQLHLRRDGKVFYKYASGETEDASSNGACSIESVETWIAKGSKGGEGFERLEQLAEI